jgi:ribosomal protein S18 acetylase RimI-like enzyme
MSEGEIRLRPAAATVLEGRSFARHLDAATDGLFRLLLGRRFVEIIADAFVQPGHDLSFEHVTFAKMQGRIVGSASAYSAVAHADADHRPLLSAASWRAARLLPMVVLMWPMVRFLDDVRDGDYYLQAIAVDDDRRGAGIGGRLIEHVEECARAAGCRRLTLDVAIENEDARRLYERLGLTVEATSPRSLLPDSRVHRMAKTLTS